MQALLRKDGDSPVFLSCFFLPVARAVFCSFSATSPPAPSTFPTLHLFPEAKGAGEGGAGEREVICPSTSVEKRKTSSSPCERTQWCLFPSVDGSGSRNGWVTRYQKENLKRLRRMRENARGRLRDPEERWRLRMKFLTQAKSYIGTPYSRKYQEPGTVEYESPLFLDCCGLVRKAVRDLSEDFGFVIGPGNQAYQYDTLPLTLEKHEDMKPGDLVFISGTYFSPHSNSPHTPR
ncbi:uncharacterized protein [Lepisosteus oculatus]|uniref:uncharacterized protein isoform X1 n=1 Tax=Lepisosteus oculatus TaxID=7918 RepID=UPI00371EFE1C